MSTLQPNQIKEGMFVTVEKWTSHKDNSYTSDIMRVIAVDLPIVGVIHKSHGKMTLSIDRCILNHVSCSFVKKIMERRNNNPVFEPLEDVRCRCCKCCSKN